MATYTLTGPILDLVGGALDGRGVRVTLESSERLVPDASTGGLRVGGEIDVELNAGTGMLTVTGIPATVDGHPLYRLRVETPGGRRPGATGTGWFPMTANRTVAWAVENSVTPVSVDATVVADISAAAAAVGEVRALKADVLAAKEAVEARVVEDLGTTDGQTKALITTPASETAKALSATIATGTRSRLRPALRPALPSAARALATFQPGHGWAKVSGPGSVGDTSQAPYVGSSALRIATTSSGPTDPTIAGFTGLAPFDLNNYDLRVTFRVSDWQNIPAPPNAGLRIRVGQNLTSQFVERAIGPLRELDTRATGARYELLGGDGKWQTSTLSFSRYSGSGSTYLGALTALGFSAADNGAPVNVDLGAIDLIPRARVSYPHGAFCFTFDDGFASVYDTAAPILAAAGMVGTAGVIADAAGLPGYMTPDQMRRLQARGWEIAAHAASLEWHNQPGAFSALTPAELEADCIRMKEWLYAEGLTSGIDVSIYPQGLFNDATVEVMSRYFSLIRTTQNFDGAETLPVGDPYRVRCVVLTDALPIATLKSYIDAAMANGAFIVLYTHQIAAGPPSGISVTPAYFAEAVEYLKGKMAQGMAHGTFGEIATKAQAAASNAPVRRRGIAPASDFGFKGWTIDGIHAQLPVASSPAGVLWGFRIYCEPGDTVNGMLFQVSAPGAGITNAVVGFYDSAGNRLAASSNAASSFLSGGPKRVQTLPVRVPADGVLVGAVLLQDATTLPQFSGVGGGSATSFDFPGTAKAARAFSHGSGLTALPPSIDLLGAVTQRQQIPWAGVN